MVPENSDPVALAAQANIHRLYIKVIQPALAEFIPTDDVVGVETADVETFLEAARRNTNNALCYEMRRTFALTIEAVFERQLRTWLSGKMPNATRKIEHEKWPELVRRLKTAAGGSAGADMAAIETLWLVANAVRHGNGRSANDLLDRAPQFWDQARTNPDSKWKSDLVGNMRISDPQLKQYVVAVLKFWHWAGASAVPAV